jgi:hypothetical protein
MGKSYLGLTPPLMLTHPLTPWGFDSRPLIAETLSVKRFQRPLSERCLKSSLNQVVDPLVLSLIMGG